MNKEFWVKKKILLTGHTGFKGSWLSLWLQKLNTELIGFSKSIPTKPSLFELADVEKGMTSVIGNICDYDKLEEVINEYKPEIVIHMAAQAILRESYSDPIETYSTNIMGTVNLFESIKKIGNVKTIINITTDKCYEPNNSLSGYIETDKLGGHDPYSTSKACSELITTSYRKSFFNLREKKNVSLATCRAGNVIGGGDWGKDRLIPDIMKGIVNHEIIKIRNPNSTRPWQYVLDPLNGYLNLVEKLWVNGSKFSEAWNFGPDNNSEKSVKWIVEKLTKQWSNDTKWDIDNNNNLHEENYLRLNCMKSNSMLGWKPKLSLEEGLRWIVEWYKDYESNYDIRETTERQIENFEKLQ